MSVVPKREISAVHQYAEPFLTGVTQGIKASHMDAIIFPNQATRSSGSDEINPRRGMRLQPFLYYVA